MATKEVMVTAPVLVLLYDRAFISGSFRSALTGHRWYYASLVATWLLLGFLMHRSSLVVVGVGFQASVNWLTYALTELRVVTDYLKLAIWPQPLVFDYGTELFVAEPLAAAPYALIITALLIAGVIAWRRSPMAGFLGCWFFLILAPTSTVVPIAEQPMAESREYLPLAAVVVTLTILGYTLGRRRAFLFLGLGVVGLGVLTLHRNKDYRSELAIWEDTVAQNPRSSRGHCSLGLALAGMPGRLPEAIAQYEDALRIKPAYAEAHNSLGRALARIPGRMAEAVAHYEEAIRIHSTYAEAHNNLAVALETMPGRLPDAISHFEAALRFKPTYAEAHGNLANALARMPSRLPEAIAHYEEALRIKPDLAETHSNLANELAEMPGRVPDAIAHYEEALRLKPDFAEAHYNLATELAKLPGRLPEATMHFEETVRLNPELVAARTALAATYARAGRLEAAIDQLQVAAKLDPTSAAIRDNLEKLRAARKP